MWYVYIVQCRDKTLYTGITNDVPARLHKHNAGKGAVYTRGRRPVRLMYSQAFGSKSLAARREAGIKQWSRRQKEVFIAAQRHNPA